MDDALQAGNILNYGVNATDGNRDEYAMFTEFALPITRQLEGQAAVLTLGGGLTIASRPTVARERF